MKDLTLIVWLTQLGLSVAAPLAMFVWLGVWLRDTLGWGEWAFWAGLIIGLYCAIDGLRNSLKTLSTLVKPKEKKDPPAAFNDHD